MGHRCKLHVLQALSLIRRRDHICIFRYRWIPYIFYLYVYIYMLYIYRYGSI